tara:strand:- start:589 stop:948 length:360 start_codon:yes stop_codon:yes gene_type:complete
MDKSKITNKVLLDNIDLYDQHISKCKDTSNNKQKRIITKYNEYLLKNPDIPHDPDISIYQMMKAIKYINLDNVKKNNYLSALNTGKLLTVNDEKLTKYNLVYDTDTKKYKRNSNIEKSQ